MIERMNDICRNEKVKIDKKTISTLLELSEGDMRRAIMTLQNISYFSNKKIENDYVYHVMGYVPEEKCNEIIKACRKGEVKDIIELSKEITRRGYPIANLIIQLKDLILENPNLSDEYKSKMVIETTLHQRNLLENGNEQIQLLDYLLKIKSC
jgi:replication factor C subunit 2/4